MNLQIRNMTRADIELGMRLKQAAGWTQTEADWQRALALEPHGCFVAEADSLGAGTVCACLFGPVAWIAMVLVDERWRGRGIGRALLERAIDFCEACGARSIRLDATPLGRPLYEKLGFGGDFELARYRGMAEMPAAGADEYQAADLPHILALDRAATLTERSKLLRALIEQERRPTRVIRTAQGLQGFCTSRPGADALQIGPCIAADSCGGPLLASALADARGTPVVVDVPSDNVESVRLMDVAGLVRERPFYRMTRGEPVRENLPQLWASFGPEKG